MTRDKIRKVIATYRTMFEEMGLEKQDYPHESFLENTDLGLAHCYGMLDKMEVYLERGRREKVMRWLGFIQGVLWTTGRRTLDSMTADNRPDPSQE